MDESVQTHRIPRWRRTRLVGMAGVVVAVAIGLLVVFRAPLAAYLIKSGLEQSGLSGVSLTVTRLGPNGVAIENLSAENGALTVARIEADFTARRLARGELNALTVTQLRAALTWNDGGVTLGAFPLRPQPDSGPLALPVIDIVNAEDVVLQVNTPTMALRAPLSLSARAVAGGWDTALHGQVEGQGVNVAAEWTGVLTPTDLALSAGRGRFTLAVDDFAVPGLGDVLNARGLVTVDAGDGVFTITFNEPLALSAASLAGTTGGMAALQDFGKQPWSLTVAPSRSNAAFVVTAAGERRAIRFDINATVQGAGGRVDLGLAGEAARERENTTVQISKARADVVSFPFGGGLVSGHMALADYAGTTQTSGGRVDAALKVADVSLADTRFDANAAFASTLRIANGRAAFDVETLRLTVDRAVLAAWTLAAPAELHLVKQATRNPHVTLGPLGSGFAADIALALPVVSLQSREDESAQVTLRLPDIKMKAQTKDIALTGSITAAGVSLDHPFAAARDGRLDAAMTVNGLSAKANARFTRLGPIRETDTAASALATSATLTTRNGDYDIRGVFATTSGTKLGDYTARLSPDFSRGTAALTVPTTRFERGGKPDAAELTFLAPLTDLSGTIGIDAKASWDGDRRSETAIATFDDVSFAVGDINVVGLSTTIDLAALLPPQSSAPGKISAKSILAGVPLTDAAAEFSLPGNGALAVAKGGVDVAGGKVTLTEATIPIDGQPGRFAVGVAAVDMARLAALAQVDGLSITGTLSGEVPLRSDGAGLHFDNGVLRADAPGRLAYTPSTPPAALSQSQGGALLVQALSNFAYDRMSITVNGPVTDEITLLVALAGKNPDLYGGYPIEFNLNLSGRLTQILQQGFVGAGIPADLERQLRQGKPP